MLIIFDRKLKSRDVIKMKVACNVKRNLMNKNSKIPPFTTSF